MDWEKDPYKRLIGCVSGICPHRWIDSSSFETWSNMPKDFTRVQGVRLISAELRNPLFHPYYSAVITIRNFASDTYMHLLIRDINEAADFFANLDPQTAYDAIKARIVIEAALENN